MSKTSREHVADLLTMIEKEDGYAQLVLKRELKQVQGEDKAFVTEVVYGTLKHSIKIDYILNKFSKTPVKKMKPLIRNILRMSVYQMIEMDKVPISAIVNEAVKITKKRKFVNLSGFVNGILRSVDRQINDIEYPNINKNTEYALSIKYSMPEWIIKEWMKVYNIDEIECICDALNKRAEVCVRFNQLKVTEDEFKNNIEVEEAQIRPGKFIKEAYYLKGIREIQNSPSFKKGEWTVQDESAMLVAHIVNPKENDLVLDMCSAPGGKSAHMAEVMKNKGEIISCDVHPHKLELISKIKDRMGTSIIQPTLNDGTIYNEKFNEKFDKVLLDAPCSGLGIMKRKPDIRTRKEAEDIGEIVNLQKQIAKQAVKYVKPDGRLVYSTCTISKRENEDMVQYIESLGMVSENITDRLPETLKKFDKNGSIQILPHIADTDGFFIASFKKGV